MSSMSKGFWGAGHNLFLDLDWVYTGLCFKLFVKNFFV